MQNEFEAVRTPKRGFAPLAAILSGRTVPALLARWALRRARRKGRPLTLGKRVIAVRHADVAEVLRRDLDFIIAPVNESRILAVNGGPFILGMDRSPALIRERGTLYAALAEVDVAAVANRVCSDAHSIIAASGQRFDAIADYARPIAVATARQLFGLAKPKDPLFAESVRAIFAHTFLNLGGDAKIEKRAVIAGGLMQTWLSEEIAARRKSGALGDDLMGLLLRAVKSGDEFGDDGVRRMLGGMLVGSIDTTASTFARIYCVAASDRGLREEMLATWRRGEDIYGLCLDALRRWPHNPIVLRQAAADTKLAGVAVSKGGTVACWTQAAMQDPDAFPDPKRALPDRPIAAYLHYGAGLHPCAGRVINAVQIPSLVGILLESGAERAGHMGWAGPFLDTLPVVISQGASR